VLAKARGHREEPGGPPFSVKKVKNDCRFLKFFLAAKAR
jgi:hypothetical protein